jgi:translation initiation factor 4G
MLWQALCEMFTVAGKKLEEASRSPARVEGYLKAMENMSKSDVIAPRIRFLIRDVLDLRRMKWVPRRETLKVGL